MTDERWAAIMCFCNGLLLVGIVWLIVLYASMLWGAEAPGASYGKISATAHFEFIKTTFDAEICVTGGPGGPRDYVAVYLSNAPTAARARCGAPLAECWKYLDNTKTPSTTRALAAGCVTFTDLGLLAQPYEVRFYRWTPADVPDELLLTRPLPQQQQSPQLVRRFLPVEEPVTINRVPIGNRDEVTIRTSTGNGEKVIMDRGVIFNIEKVQQVAPTPASSEP